MLNTLMWHQGFLTLLSFQPWRQGYNLCEVWLFHEESQTDWWLTGGILIPRPCGLRVYRRRENEYRRLEAVSWAVDDLRLLVLLPHPRILTERGATMTLHIVGSTCNLRKLTSQCKNSDTSMGACETLVIHSKIINRGSMRCHRGSEFVWWKV